MLKPMPEPSVPPTRFGNRALLACLAVSVLAHGVGLAAALRGVSGHRTDRADDLAFQRPAPAQIGETFDVPVEEVDRGNPPPAAEATAEPALVAPRDDGASSHRRPPRPPRHAEAPAAAAPGTGGTDTATFGAVGDRSAIDVATAFTRGFPQAASADAAWTGAAFGPAGSVDVTLVIDESGALIDSQVRGTTSPALGAGVRRTLALIRARSFVATRRETHLRITATVSPDQVHDGLHGEVFAIGGSFDHGEGSGFFALAVGRRIDVKVREIR